jgi:hypothetical protein
MTAMHVVAALQCLPTRGDRWWRDSVSAPLEEAGQREAAR